MTSRSLDAISHNIASLDISNGSSKQSPLGGYEASIPATPKLYSQGFVATDVTARFKQAADKLEVGQLVKDSFFTLYESVAALEIMDPKMDSGHLEPGESMNDDFDFRLQLLPEEVIGIIDQLICHEMAWHMGYPLSQTIFTSLHVDRILSPPPSNIEETYFVTEVDRSERENITSRVLRSYCLGMIKTCWFVNSRVMSEHFYEEEDFVTHTYNRSLLENIHHDDILQLLHDTSELLTKNDQIPSGLKFALLSRLRFRGILLRAVESSDSRTSPMSAALWQLLRPCLPELQSTAKHGKPVPECFSIKLQRKLASTVPPRPMVQVSQETAYEHLNRLCEDAAVASKVLKYHDSHSLMNFVFLFQARKPQPSVYVRTLLQHYLFGDMIILGTMSIRQVLDDDLSTTVLPANELLDKANDEIELPHDPRFSMAKQMEFFRSRAAGSYLDILRTICQNRCRIRRTLCHTIADWDNLQLDAEELDLGLREYTKEEPIIDKANPHEPVYSLPLSSWVYFYKLRQMEWLIQMGFELEVYRPDELAAMYWYLKYISKTRSGHLERIRGFVMRRFSVSRIGSQALSKDPGEYAKALAYINYSMADAATTYGFADALSCIFTVLARLKLIQAPSTPYSDDQKRYKVRMKPFLEVGLPELVPFEELGSLVDQSDESILDILNFAADSVTSVKKRLEAMSKLSAEDAYCQGSHESWLKDVKNRLKACIFTGITIASVKRAVEKWEKKATGPKGDMALKIEIPVGGKGYHDWWVVPKVTSIN